MSEVAPRSQRPVIREARQPGVASRWLDRTVNSPFGPFGSTGPPFLVLGVAGVGCSAVALTCLLTWQGYSAVVLIPLVVAGLAGFVLLGLAEKAVLGRERHVLFENILLILAIDGVVAGLLGRPVLPVLDMVCVSLGVALVFGRCGCLFHGCCHGLPSDFGVRYLQGLHTDDPLTGVRLFPLPLVEAAVLVVVTGLGAAMLASSAPPGTALLFWLTAYAIARFLIEFERGDRARRLIGPLTGPQWTGIAVVLGRVGYEQAQRQQVDRPGLIAVAGCAFLCALAYWSRRYWLASRQVRPSRAEVTAWQYLLDRLAPAALTGPGEARATCVLGGRPVEVSARVETGSDANLHAYAVHVHDGPVGPEEARVAGGLILQQLGPHEVLSAAVCGSGALHLLVSVYVGGPAGSTGDDDPDDVALRARSAAQEMFPILVAGPAPAPGRVAPPS